MKKPYNGLRHESVPAFGGVIHDLSGGRDRQAVIQQAFAQQMQALMREMYVRGAARLMDGGDQPAETYRELAAECQIAALAYFEGLGLIQPKEPEPTEAEQPDPAT